MTNGDIEIHIKNMEREIERLRDALREQSRKIEYLEGKERLREGQNFSPTQTTRRYY